MCIGASVGTVRRLFTSLQARIGTNQMTTANKLLTTINHRKPAGQSILFLVPNKMDIKELRVIPTSGAKGLLVKAKKKTKKTTEEPTS